jgi:hypothetical protein
MSLLSVVLPLRQRDMGGLCRPCRSVLLDSGWTDDVTQTLQGSKGTLGRGTQRGRVVTQVDHIALLQDTPDLGLDL